MSLTARCTACDTTFRVVPDQLKIADGWVRCGRCGTVFDALDRPAAPVETPAVAASPAAVFTPVFKNASPPPGHAADDADLAGVRTVAQPAAVDPLPSPAAAALPSAGVLPGWVLRSQARQPPAADAAGGAAAHRAAGPGDDTPADALASGDARDVRPTPADGSFGEADRSGSGPRGRDVSGRDMPASADDPASLPSARAGVAPRAADVGVATPDTAAAAGIAWRSGSPAAAGGPAFADSDELADDASDAAAEVVRALHVDRSALLAEADVPDVVIDSSPDADDPVDLPPPIERYEFAAVGLGASEPTFGPPVMADPTLSATVPQVSEDALHDPAPSFVRQSDRAARWHRPWVRALLGLTALALLVLLGAQVVYWQRDTLAARSPLAAQALQPFCETLGCRIEPLRQLGAITVETSSLARVPERDDVIRLSLALRNRSDGPLALPSIDLSLTDATGKLVARRVLHPAELGRSDLPPDVDVPLQVLLRAPGVAGYTLEIFYP